MPTSHSPSLPSQRLCKSLLHTAFPRISITTGFYLGSADSSLQIELLMLSPSSITIFKLLFSFASTHRIREYLRLEVLEIVWSMSPGHSRINYNSLIRIMSSWVLSISRDGGATTVLDNLLQCWTILKVKLFLLMFKWNFQYFSLCPLHHLFTGDLWEQSGSTSRPPIRYQYAPNMQFWGQKQS